MISLPTCQRVYINPGTFYLIFQGRQLDITPSMADTVVQPVIFFQISGSGEDATNPQTVTGEHKFCDICEAPPMISKPTAATHGA